MPGYGLAGKFFCH